MIPIKHQRLKTQETNVAVASGNRVSNNNIWMLSSGTNASKNPLSLNAHWVSWKVAHFSMGVYQLATTFVPNPFNGMHATLFNTTIAPLSPQTFTREIRQIISMTIQNFVCILHALDTVIIVSLLLLLLLLQTQLLLAVSACCFRCWCRLSCYLVLLLVVSVVDVDSAVTWCCCLLFPLLMQTQLLLAVSACCFHCCCILSCYLVLLLVVSVVDVDSAVRYCCCDSIDILTGCCLWYFFKWFSPSHNSVLQTSNSVFNHVRVFPK